METSLLPVPASELMAKARLVSDNVAIFLPRHSDPVQVSLLAACPDATTPRQVELEQNFLEHSLTAVTAYFGDLVNATAT